MAKSLMWQDLTGAQRRIVRLMQRINFGRIEALAVKHGEPVFDPPPRIVRQVKFGADNGARPEAAKEDFALKAQVCDLFAELEGMSDGVIRSLEVKHGLPFKMAVEEDAA